MAGLVVNDETLQKAERFLVSVSSEDESQYGYREPGGRPNLTASALCSRLVIGWTPGNPSFQKGVDSLMQRVPTMTDDRYFLYYAAQAVYERGGDQWE